MRLRRSYGAPVAALGGWSPSALGASLLAGWDAERADLITGSTVSSWRDIVGGYDAVQGTSDARPSYSATSFNGRPGITFDGTDDELTYAATTGLPTGSTACEVWMLFDQTALAADTSTRNLFTWGGATSATFRTMRRTVSVGVNRFNTTSGNGTTANTAGSPAVDFSGRSTLRGIFAATEITASINGTAGTTTANTPSIGTTRTRIGASNGTSASAFAKGVLNCIFVTAILDAAQAAQMAAFLDARKG